MSDATHGLPRCHQGHEVVVRPALIEVEHIIACQRTDPWGMVSDHIFVGARWLWLARLRWRLAVRKEVKL